MNTILFPGSFNPFTIGHQSLVSRVLPLFDRVVIAIGHNSGKQTEESLEQRIEAIRALYAPEPKIRVISYEGLTIDACRREGAPLCSSLSRNMRLYHPQWCANSAITATM